MPALTFLVTSSRALPPQPGLRSLRRGGGGDPAKAGAGGVALPALRFRQRARPRPLDVRPKPSDLPVGARARPGRPGAPPERLRTWGGCALESAVALQGGLETSAQHPLKFFTLKGLGPTATLWSLTPLIPFARGEKNLILLWEALAQAFFSGSPLVTLPTDIIMSLFTVCAGLSTENTHRGRAQCSRPAPHSDWPASAKSVQ